MTKYQLNFDTYYDEQAIPYLAVNIVIIKDDKIKLLTTMFVINLLNYKSNPNTILDKIELLDILKSENYQKKPVCWLKSKNNFENIYLGSICFFQISAKNLNYHLYAEEGFGFYCYQIFAAKQYRSSFTSIENTKNVINDFLQISKFDNIDKFWNLLTNVTSIIENDKNIESILLEEKQIYESLIFNKPNNEKIEFNITRVLSKSIYHDIFEIKNLNNEQIIDYIYKELYSEDQLSDNLLDLIEFFGILNAGRVNILNIIQPNSRDIVLNFNYNGDINKNCFIFKGTQFKNYGIDYLSHYSYKYLLSKFNFLYSKTYNRIKPLFNEIPSLFTGHSYGALHAKVLGKKYEKEFKISPLSIVFSHPWQMFKAKGEKTNYNGNIIYKENANTLSICHEKDPVSNYTIPSILTLFSLGMVSYFLPENNLILDSLLLLNSGWLIKNIYNSKSINHKISLFGKDNSYHHKGKTPFHIVVTMEDRYLGLGNYKKILDFLMLINGKFKMDGFFNSNGQTTYFEMDDWNNMYQKEYLLLLKNSINLNHILANCLKSASKIKLDDLFENENFQKLVQIFYEEEEIMELKNYTEEFFNSIKNLKITFK